MKFAKAVDLVSFAHTNSCAISTIVKSSTLSWWQWRTSTRTV